jgi:[protein-PII] uridylyltransferase
MKSFHELTSLAVENKTEFLTISRSDCLAATRLYAEEKRSDIHQQHRAGASGTNVVRMLSDLADELVLGIFQFALNHVSKPHVIKRRTALCAHGGYGKRQLNPHSDLDLGLAYEGRLDKNIEELTDYIVPFVWDLGYENSFVSRSIKDALVLSANDTKVFTSYLGCRLLVGNPELYARLKLAIEKMKPKDVANRFSELQLRERGDNLPEADKDVYAPEPDIKNGSGGLRDYQTAIWLYTLAHGAHTLDELSSQSLITEEERINTAEALDHMWSIRNELHFQAGKPQERLTFQFEQDVAVAMGYTDEQTRDTSRFMQDYYFAARQLRLFLQHAAHNCGFYMANGNKSSNDGDSVIEVIDGELHVSTTDKHWIEENPTRVMALFWECARHKAVLNPATSKLIRDNLHLIGDAFQKSDLVRRYFVSICNRPIQAGRILRMMADAGVLERYIPEFGNVRDIVRYEDFHHYPVDEHTLRTFEALAVIPDQTGMVGEFLETALERLTDPHILVLALLFHDLGKVEGEEHSEAGMILAKNIGNRIGLPDEETEMISFLVKHHLLMTHFAFYRDTDDSDVIENFSNTIRSENRLRLLFLLSYADMSAVGPNVWNDWKGQLLVKLYLKTEKVLLGHQEVVAESFWEHPKTEQIIKEKPEIAREHIIEHIQDLGLQYFSAFTAELIAEHIGCIQEAESFGFSSHCLENDDGETSEVIVCTRDHPGLFKEITGCLASLLVDVEWASVHTRSNGMTLDSFRVVNPGKRTPLTPLQIHAINEKVLSVVNGHKKVEDLLKASQQRIYAVINPPVPVKCKVAFDNEVSRQYTVVDITGGDRTGLLFDIADVFEKGKLDIASARIVTDARRVRDAFYITYHGNKIIDIGMQNDLEKALLNAIQSKSAA